MSIKKEQVLELFSSNPEKEFSFNELVEFFRVRTKPRKKLMPFIQSLTNTGFLYRLGKDRYISSQSAAAKAAKEAKGEKIEETEDKEIIESKNKVSKQNQKQDKKQGQRKDKKQDYRRGSKAGKSTNENVIGRFIRNIEGFGFVSPLEDGDDMYIDKHDVMWNGIMHGDIIKVLKFYEPSKRRSYGKFIEFVSRREARAIGRVVQTGGTFAVELRKTLEVVMIQHGRLNRARKGDWVEVEIKKWPEGRAPAYGEIVKIVDADTYIVLKEYHLTEEFPRPVIEESERIKEPPQSEQRYLGEMYTDERGVKRKNLSLIPTVTIDGKTARDFDDAISYKSVGDEHLLYVSIADVSHYVIPNSAIDEEAQKRTTSVYFPDRAIPMLPESLSSDICSLKPNRYRYCMTAEMLFDKTGHVKNTKIYPSVIKSSYRFTYEKAQKIIQPDFDQIDPNDLVVYDVDQKIRKMIKGMFSLYLVLKKNSEKRGTLFLDIPEAEVIVDEKGNIQDIKKRAVWDSHRLIEEFMIAANIQTAKKMKEMGKGVYRIHEKPNPEKLQNYADIARIYKTAFDPLWENAGDLSTYLKGLEKNPARSLLNKMLLRSLKKAKYSSARDVGHFALALVDYTHFTSPIRRYPDLIVHRLLKGTSHYDEASLKHFADICSQGEINAMEAERSITRIKQARYMEDKVGKKFIAEITGLNDYGMFVQLKDVFIEGYLPFSKLGTDYFVFDSTKMAVSGKRTKLKYKLGDDIDVIVTGVDVFEGKVDFAASIQV